MPLVLERLGIQVIVRMFGFIGGLAGDPIILAGPGTEIDHLASLRTKWTKPIGRPHVDGLLANRASHLRKLPKLRASRNARMVSASKLLRRKIYAQRFLPAARERKAWRATAGTLFAMPRAYRPPRISTTEGRLARPNP